MSKTVYLQEKLESTLSHAYVLEGDKNTILPELFAVLEKEHNAVTRGNPDFWCREFDSFGIDDAHNVRTLQTRKPVYDGRKFFIIAFTTISTEAQNALLKTLEEPTQGTHFFIITPTLKQIVPTLLSRATVISRERMAYGTHGEKLDEGVQKFLHARPSKRLSLIQNIIKEKDKDAAQRFLNQLEIALWQRESPQERTVKVVRALEEIIQARKHLATRAPSLKLIFEHVALIVPSL